MPRILFFSFSLICCAQPAISTAVPQPVHLELSLATSPQLEGPATCSPSPLPAPKTKGPGWVRDWLDDIAGEGIGGIVEVGPGSPIIDSITTPLGHEVTVVDFDVVAFDDMTDLRQIRRDGSIGQDWRIAVTLVLPTADWDPSSLALFSGGTGSDPVGIDDPDPIWGHELPPWFAGAGGAQRSTYTHNGELDLRRWLDANPRWKSYADLLIPRGVAMAIVQTVPVPMYIEPGSETAQRLLDLALTNDDVCDDDTVEDLSCASDADNPLDVERLHQCLVRDAWVTREATRHPALRYAVSLSRVVDAVQTWLDLNHPGFEPVSRVWATGCSKSGWPLRHLLAIDQRIDGAIAACLDHANYDEYAAQQQALWPDDQGFSAQWLGLNSMSDAEDLTNATDMVRWDPLVFEDRMLVTAMGTNDHHSPVGSAHTWFNAAPAEHRAVFVPNAGHTSGTVDHMTALATLIDHRRDGVPWPRVDAYWDITSAQISARITEGTPDRVEVWCATFMNDTPHPRAETVDPETCAIGVPEVFDGTDLRSARWERVSMMTLTQESRTWAGTPWSTLAYPACVVRAVSQETVVSTSIPLMSRERCIAAGLNVERLP